MLTLNYFTTEKLQSQYILMYEKMPYATHRPKVRFANSQQEAIVWFQSCLQRYPKIVSKFFQSCLKVVPRLSHSCVKVVQMLSLSCPEDVLILSQCCQKNCPKFFSRRP